MRIELKNDGVRVKLLGTSLVKVDGVDSHKATLAYWRKKLPDLEFDAVSIVDEEIEAAALSKLDAAFQSELSDYANSDYGKAESEYIIVMRELALSKKAAWIASYLNQPKSAEGVLRVDNFQDGKSEAPFSLIVRNESADTVSFIAVVRDVPYEKIPALVAGDYKLETAKEGGGYTHTFTAKVGGKESITINGGAPSPAGAGKTDTSPELYLT